MSSMNRREFLLDTAALAAALAAADAAAAPLLAAQQEAARKKGNIQDQLRAAVIGVHGQGKGHVRALANRNNCIITTICDADSAVIGDAMRMVEKEQGKAPKYVQDIRKVVEDKDIDI